MAAAEPHTRTMMMPGIRPSPEKAWALYGERRGRQAEREQSARDSSARRSGGARDAHCEGPSTDDGVYRCTHARTGRDRVSKTHRGRRGVRGRGSDDSLARFAMQDWTVAAPSRWSALRGASSVSAWRRGVWSSGGGGGTLGDDTRGDGMAGAGRARLE